MMNFFYNAGYYRQEVKNLFLFNRLSHILSLLSIGLIFFLLGLVVSGGWISSRIMQTVRGEAEINVFFDESISEKETHRLAEEIRALQGVRETRIVDKDEAYDRMLEILGKEAQVWEFFDHNPFSPFIEVKIHLEEIDFVREGLNHLAGVEYVRDNKEVLERLRDISGAGRLLGYLIIAAVSISTVVIISHIIRLGIDSNREQITTLRLLGAPETFISIPFLLAGLLITLGGGILALLLLVITLRQVYLYIAVPLPFVPLPPLEHLTIGLAILIPAISIVLGLAGSFFGLRSAKD
ncbi:MAG: cell division protein FtsX [Bacillota bacterium]|jgi:cell division transport system permease protein|nr:hypothetical protein [Clostridia bacterium]